MWKKWKESEFYKKMRQVRVNRAIYLTAVIILLALAVVLSITAATNRAKKRGAENVTEATGTQESVTTPTPQSTAIGDDSPTVKEETVPEFSLPVSGTLTQGHSVDLQVFSKTMNDYRVHLGIDIATAEGAAVCAAADGTVAQIWEDPMMGWCVALNHTGACVTVYKNLAKDLAEDLAVGDSVKQGQLLGYVGDSAMLEIAEEPHLHMEMTVNGLQVNPLDYFSQAVLNTLGDDQSFETGTEDK